MKVAESLKQGEGVSPNDLLLLQKKLEELLNDIRRLQEEQDALQKLLQQKQNQLERENQKGEELQQHHDFLKAMENLDKNNRELFGRMHEIFEKLRRLEMVINDKQATLRLLLSSSREENELLVSEIENAS